MAGNNPKIIIVGCGIVGLSTGVSIQNTIPNAEVMIVADAFLQDITSFGAAGIIRISSFKSGDTPTEEIGRRWFHDTYSLCTNLFNSPEAKKAGVSRISGYFLEGNKEELINLFDFVSRFLNNGGQIEKRTVKSLAEFAGKCDVVINCTGLRAKQLVGDNSIFGVRGQVFKVKAPWIKHFYYHNLNTYVIPGIDYVTIGGTRQLSEPANEINPFDSISIMEKAVRLVPSLKNAEVAKQWVGLRPTRHPIRVEKEILKFGDREVKVVHNYGHGGYGVTLCWGTARHATELLLEFLNGMGITKVTPASIPSML
ncbi:D-aspartate oxidase [Nymphon striatum]|nr:D-aspartate oxidase [Nymphon striatum]